MVLVEGFVAVAVAVALAIGGLHQVAEGHVGLYYRGAALTTRVEGPGFHVKIPWLDTLVQVQTTLQSDSVKNIPCGTSGGVLITFGRIEVVNFLQKGLAYDTVKNYTADYDRLWIFDKVHHEVNQFCSKHTLREVYIDLFHTFDESLQQQLQDACDVWAPGIRIVAVRVTKPTLPAEIEQSFRAMELEKSKLLIAVEAQRVVEKEAETGRKKAVIEAEKNAEVAAILTRQQLLEKEGAQRAAAIEDEIVLHRARYAADAEAYAAQQRAEANAALLTPAFLALRSVEALGASTRVYFGPSIPPMFVDPAGAVAAFTAAVGGGGGGAVARNASAR